MTPIPAPSASPSPPASARWWPAVGALVVLLVGLVLTAELARREAAQTRVAAEELQRSLSDAAQARLRGALGRAAESLRSMQTVFLSNDQVDQSIFDRYQDNLRDSGMLPGHVVTAFARRRIEDGRPTYRYESLTPRAGNEVLLGFDAASQPENLRALERARDSDAPTLSAPFALRQFEGHAQEQALGVTVRLPVYSHGQAPTQVAERREREIGALALSLRLQPMVEQVLDGRILEFMQVELCDLEGGQPLHAAAGSPAAADAQVRLVEFGGRRWELRMWPRPEAMPRSDARAVVGGGIAISALLALLLWSLASTHQRAVELGGQMRSRFGESEARFRTLNELLPALVLLVDARSGDIVYANQAARRHLGAVVGQPLRSVFVDGAAGELALSVAEGGPAWDGREVQVSSLGGELLWVSASLAAVDVDGSRHLLMVASDTTEQRRLTERLVHQAAHDSLTGLCNRREFERRLQHALALLDAGAGSRRGGFALLYIDLDQFKLVNDLSGHMAGDQLLIELTLAMQRQLRPEDLLARLGGDEFGLLAAGTGEDDAVALAERMRACIEQVMFVWEGRTYTVSASIGVVVVDHPGATLKDLLAWADSACYQAKDNGRNRTHVYRDDGDSTRRQGEMEWANRLRQALEDGRLLLDYQEVRPLHAQAGDAGVHVELLLRLCDEQGQVVPPGAFLPAAERYGLMPAVDRWVIQTALAGFDRLHPAGAALATCAINLSGASIEDEGLADFILGCLAQHRIPPQRLCLEITETVAVRNLMRVAIVIERLRAAGCRIALDDFGAGMSSFGYLKNLPVDAIKIDGSFVRDVTRDPMSRAIVDAVTRIGHQLGLRVVAEWVDDPRTLAALHEIGVDDGQGFALHRPERVLFMR